MVERTATVPSARPDRRRSVSDNWAVPAAACTGKGADAGDRGEPRERRAHARGGVGLATIGERSARPISPPITLPANAPMTSEERAFRPHRTTHGQRHEDPAPHPLDAKPTVPMACPHREREVELAARRPAKRDQLDRDRPRRRTAADA